MSGTEVYAAVTTAAFVVVWVMFWLLSRVCRQFVQICREALDGQGRALRQNRHLLRAALHYRRQYHRMVRAFGELPEER